MKHYLVVTDDQGLDWAGVWVVMKYNPSDKHTQSTLEELIWQAIESQSQPEELYKVYKVSLPPEFDSRELWSHETLKGLKGLKLVSQINLVQRLDWEEEPYDIERSLTNE